MRRIALAACLALSPMALADEAETIIEAAKAECASFEGGTLALEPGALSEADLTGDGAPEMVVDTRYFACSTAASLFCGTGGCMVHILHEGGVYERLVKGYQVVSWGDDRIILFALHGSECDGDNTRRCYEAVTWSDGGFRSVRPPDN